MKYPRFVIYEDQAGEWRWRLVAGNGRVVADGSESYVSRSNVVRAVRRVVELAAVAEVDG